MSKALDRYDAYEEQFDPTQTDRQARRRRKPKKQHLPKKSSRQIVQEVADTTGIEGEFETTYKPARYEQGWLLKSLREFYDQSLISDVLALVKGGKEASLYRCQADPATGREFIAAKVYRPKKFRNLRNDQMYREGRPMLKAAGQIIKKNENRILKALGKNTRFGDQVKHTSWLMYEFLTLATLFEAGGAVPEPLGVNENTVLMSYIGSAQEAAPTLHEISLSQDECAPLWAEIRRNIELLLQHEMIHGDLSPYNILYWEGRVTLIDFPQVVNSTTNPKARFILERDLERVCDYFVQHGLELDSQQITDELWQKYVATDPEAQKADQSRRKITRA